MKQCLAVTMVLVLSAVFAIGCTRSGAPITTQTPPESTSEMTESSFFLNVIQPANESIINSDKVEVAGVTVPGAVVSINGDLAEVDSEGNFKKVVFLEEGPNIIEAIASDLQGNEENYSLVIVYVPSEMAEAGFFLNVTQPVNGSTTNSDKVEVKGCTSSGAVVTVNGELTEVDNIGNFTMMVFLEEGPNLIEVIASDVEGNQQNETIVIIYVP